MILSLTTGDRPPLIKRSSWDLPPLTYIPGPLEIGPELFFTTPWKTNLLIRRSARELSDALVRLAFE